MQPVSISLRFYFPEIFKVSNVKNQKVCFASLAAGILLSAVLIGQSHFHNELFPETSCVLCFYQVNFDADLDSAFSQPIHITLPDHPDDISGPNTFSYHVFYVARSPPDLLVS